MEEYSEEKEYKKKKPRWVRSRSSEDLLRVSEDEGSEKQNIKSYTEYFDKNKSEDSFKNKKGSCEDTFEVDIDENGFFLNIFPEEKMRRDEDVPLDQLLSSLFSEIRHSRVEKAMFFASCIDRMGYSEGVWKNLGIFSFREIGYGYPEAPIYVYDYYCSWLEEMRRHREELACRLKYACTHAILHNFPKIYGRWVGFSKEEEDGMDDTEEKEKKKKWNEEWDEGDTPSSLEELIIKCLSEEERKKLLEDIRLLITTKESIIEKPSYETPCSCGLRKSKMINKKSKVESEAVFSELDMVSHLTTARHILFSIVNYLCALPKSSLSLDVSFHTAYKCQGKLMDQDWNIRLSFTELDYSIFKIRKDKDQAVQQLVVCLCSSIIHRDEERAIRMTDLFHVWKEENLFWSCLLEMCEVHKDCYQWVKAYIEKYRDAWRSFDSCKEYFIEGCRSSLFTATLLILRGPPPRDKKSYSYSTHSSFSTPSPGMTSFGNNLILSPSQINYSKDYVKIIYGSQTPSYESLSFLNKYSPCPLQGHSDRKDKLLKVIRYFNYIEENKIPIDNIESFQEREYERSSSSSTDSPQNTMYHLAKYISPSIGMYYTGNQSSGKEPYVVRCYSDPMSKSSIVKTNHKYEGSYDIHNDDSNNNDNGKEENLPIKRDIDFRNMINKSELNARSISNRRKDVRSHEENRKPKGNEMILNSSNEKLEVPIQESSIDWTTDLGRRWGKGYNHAHLRSHNYMERAKISNEYFMCNESAIKEQEKDAKRNRDEMEISMRGMHNGIYKMKELIYPSSEVKNEKSNEEGYSDCDDNNEDDYEEIRYSSEFIEYIKVMENIKNLERKAWYDPGILFQYRELSMRAMDLQDKIFEMKEQRSYQLKSNLRFREKKDFLLNLVDIESNKKEINIRNLGRDDILMKIYSLEDKKKENIDESVQSIENNTISRIRSMEKSHSMEDLTKKMSDKLILKSSSDYPTIENSLSPAKEKRKHTKSSKKKRWYRVSNESEAEENNENDYIDYIPKKIDMENCKERNETTTDILLESEHNTNINIGNNDPKEKQLVNKFNEENVVFSYEAFGVNKKTNGYDEGKGKGKEEESGKKSMVYISVDQMTKEIYSTICIGPFKKSEELEKVVIDIDLRESLGIPNIYVGYCIMWAKIGYESMKEYLKKEMDHKPTVSTDRDKDKAKKRDSDGEKINSILKDMEDMKKIKTRKLFSGYRKPSDYIIENHPFYLDCILSNISPDMLASSESIDIYNRNICTFYDDDDDDEKKSPSYYIHYFVKICKLPFIIYNRKEKWNSFKNFCKEYIKNRYERHQLQLNPFFNEGKKEEEKERKQFISYIPADRLKVFSLKLLENIVFYIISSKACLDIKKKANDLCNNMIYFGWNNHDKSRDDDDDDDDDEKYEYEIYFSIYPFLIDSLTDISSFKGEGETEQEENEIYSSPENFFVYLCKIIGEDSLSMIIPEGIYKSIISILESEEGHLWYCDIINLWLYTFETNFVNQDTLDKEEMDIFIDEKDKDTKEEMQENQTIHTLFSLKDITISSISIQKIKNRLCKIAPESI